MSFINYNELETELFEAIDSIAKAQLEMGDTLSIMVIDPTDQSVTIKANTLSSVKAELAKDEYFAYEDYVWCAFFPDVFEEQHSISLILETEAEETDDFYAFELKVLDVCKSAMIRFKESDTYKKFHKLFLNVDPGEHIKEIGEDTLFEAINGENSVEEFVDWLQSLKDAE